MSANYDSPAEAEIKRLQAQLELAEGTLRSYNEGRVVTTHLTETLQREVEKLRAALEESVKLQSHYATNLNAWDGGLRLRFVDADDWLSRLGALKNGTAAKDVDERRAARGDSA